MTDAIEVPGPEPGWETAPDYQGVKRNPARQYFTFDEAIGQYREIAVLAVGIADIARRLRLMLEPGNTAQLGPVDAAFFSLSKTCFAVFRYATQDITILGVLPRDGLRPVGAVDILLEALGIDWRAVISVNLGDGRDPLFLAPVLDDTLRPTFPGIQDIAEQSAEV